MKPSWGALAKWVAALVLTAGMLGMLFTQSRPPAHDLHTESMRFLQETERENAQLIQETLRLRVELSEAYGRMDNVRDRLIQNNKRLRPAMQASIGRINESLNSSLEALTKEVDLQYAHVEEFKKANSRKRLDSVSKTNSVEPKT